MKSPGALAIVLHTHMPYVEGFGTWPFGEEWLWEAVAGSYLPLLETLDRAAAEAPDGRAPITLSLTPVLCDQLEAPGAIERCIRFLREVRSESHRLDIEDRRAAGDLAAVGELERSAAEYAGAAARLAELEQDGGLLSALGAHASWTSSATHAILPLLCLDEGIDLQLRTGIDAHRRRVDPEWAGGLWLPECAYAPWLDERLEAAGVKRACVELTGHFGLGAAEHLTPLHTPAGPVLWSIDRATIALVWGTDGYPARPGYRAYDALTPRHHRLWSTDGGPYDPERARLLVREHAADFVAHARRRVAAGGTCVCALDTELLGHWWYEGPLWLGAVLDEARRQGLELIRLDDAAVDGAAPMPAVEAISWGEGGDLRTWSAPRVADLAWRARAAELRSFRSAGAGARAAPSARARRELLALESSDWAFLAYRAWAGDYPRERAMAHEAALDGALKDPDASEREPHLRNLAPYLR